MKNRQAISRLAVFLGFVSASVFCTKFAAAQILMPPPPRASTPPQDEQTVDDDLRRKREQRLKRDAPVDPEGRAQRARRDALYEEATTPRHRQAYFDVSLLLVSTNYRGQREAFRDNPTSHFNFLWRHGGKDMDGKRGMFSGFRLAPFSGTAKVSGVPGNFGLTYFGPAIGWEKLGWPDWTLYRPVFEAVPLKAVIGGGLGRKAIRQAIGDGAEAAAAASADPELVRAMTAELPEGAQAAMETEMIAAHCNKLPARAAPGMVEAQRLRDASFAAAALRALEAGGGKTVLITGNGHARNDRGVPIYLEQLAPEVSALSVGFIETELDPAATVKDQPFDFVWATLPAARPDPCLAFQ